MNTPDDAAAQEWLISSSADPDAKLFVRARGEPGALPVVLVHGFFQPASAILDVPGYSLQQALAQAGFRVYLFDLRGYGRSTRPAFMDAAPDASTPSLGCMADALADLGDVVSFVQQQEQAARVDLLGYSWGTARSASFVLRAPERIRRMALYAPVWQPASGAAAEAGDGGQPPKLNPRLGGYRVLRPGDLRRGWDWEIGDEDQVEFRDLDVLARAEDALMASDPRRHFAERGFRAPLGPHVDALAVQRGAALFDASRLRHDVVLLRGAQDRLSSERDASGLFAATGSSHKRLVTIGRGTHLLHLERNRWQLIDELVGFFSSQNPA